ncbi:MAG: hypothetical protein KKE17_13745 [Proteobacteria bacterium]|nr:hypothetical protein [Pseudomonadota bacterium]MBU1711061.1 hypothetical protein [Pseudomonadota bacterium]
MSLKNCTDILFRNNRGMGLIAVIFVVVVVSLFGLVITRHVSTDSISSGEDYVWAQGLYSAESAAQLKILCYDGGGIWAGACGGFTFPIVNGYTTTTGVPPIDSPGGVNNPSIINVRANYPNLGLSREIEIKYIL